MSRSLSTDDFDSEDKPHRLDVEINRSSASLLSVSPPAGDAKHLILHCGGFQIHGCKMIRDVEPMLE